MPMFRTQLHSPPLLVLAFFLPLFTDCSLCFAWSDIGVVIRAKISYATI